MFRVQLTGHFGWGSYILCVAAVSQAVSSVRTSAVTLPTVIVYCEYIVDGFMPFNHRQVMQWCQADNHQNYREGEWDEEMSIPGGCPGWRTVLRSIRGGIVWGKMSYILPISMPTSGLWIQWQNYNTIKQSHSLHLRPSLVNTASRMCSSTTLDSLISRISCWRYKQWSV